MQFFTKAEGVIRHFDFQQIELPERGRRDLRYRKTTAIAVAGRLFGIAAQEANFTTILNALYQGDSAGLSGNRASTCGFINISSL